MVLTMGVAAPSQPLAAVYVVLQWKQQVRYTLPKFFGYHLVTLGTSPCRHQKVLLQEV